MLLLKTPTMAMASSSYLLRSDIWQPSLSCGNKGYVGLRALSPSCIGVGKPNLNMQFQTRVYRSLRSRTGKSSRSPVFMMARRTPLVRYPMEGPGQQMDMWNALYRERVIFIGQEIDEDFSTQMLKTLLYLDSVDDSKNLYLFISSNGGDLTPAFSLYDTMQSLRSPVATHCLGSAYNMACFLLAAGDKGKRTAFPQSSFTLEAPAAASAPGEADHIINESNELLSIRDYLFQELSKLTRQPVDKIRKDLRMIKGFTAEEGIEYGLIDRIVRPPRITADESYNQWTLGLG